MPVEKLGDLLTRRATPAELRQYFLGLLDEELLISFFNNKGGVGKSSACSEMAVTLARRGLKVLIVDADSQGSVSSRVLHRMFVNIGRVQFPDETDEQVLADVGEDSVRNRTVAVDGDEEQDLLDIYDFFNQVYSRPANPQEFDQAVQRVKLFEAPLNSPVEEGGGVWVLLGSLKLGLLDPLVATTMTVGGAVNMANMSAPGSLPMALRSLARDRGFDAVLIDLNPEATSLNQSLFMGSGAYLVPYMADFSSLRAVKNLNEIITRWDRTIGDRNLRREGIGQGLDPTGCFPEKPLLMGGACHRIPARMPRAHNRARSSIIRQLLPLVPPERREGVNSIVSYVVSEGSSTAVAAGLDGTTLADMTREAAKRIHHSEAGKTITAARHFAVGEKIGGEYLVALQGMLAALPEAHRAHLHEDLFRAHITPVTPRDEISPKPIKNNRRPKHGNHIREDAHGATYRLESVPGDGNCGLTAMNIARDEFCATLLRSILEESEGANSNLRYIRRRRIDPILQEIMEVLSDQRRIILQGEPLARWTQLSARFAQLTLEEDRARAQWVGHISAANRDKAENVRSEEAFYEVPELVHEAELNAEIEPQLLMWTQAVQQTSQIKMELETFLRMPEVVNAFLENLSIDKQWVGIQTLIMFAKVCAQPFSLFIHRTGVNGVIEHPRDNEQFVSDQAGARSVHLLFTGNHFDRLVPTLHLQVGQQAAGSSSPDLQGTPGGRKRAAPAPASGSAKQARAAPA